MYCQLQSIRNLEINISNSGIRDRILLMTPTRSRWPSRPMGFPSSVYSMVLLFQRIVQNKSCGSLCLVAWRNSSRGRTVLVYVGSGIETTVSTFLASISSGLTGAYTYLVVMIVLCGACSVAWNTTPTVSSMGFRVS